MKTITKTIELFTATELQTLHPTGFENALNNFRESEQEFFSIKDNAMLEDFTSIAGYVGFDTAEFEDTFQYTGFYSQGDGASFVATWNLADLDIQGLTTYAPKDTELHNIQDSFDRLKDSLKSLNVEKITMYRFGHHYSHCNTVGFNGAMNQDGEYIELLKDYETMFDECARNLMGYFYARIRGEYESLGDVHTFLDYALNNETLFLENGEIYND